MKKTISIVSYAIEEANYQKEQLISLFGESIDVGIYYPDRSSLVQGLDEDLVLVPSYEIFYEIKKHITKSAEVVIGSRTLSKSAFERVMALENGTRALLVDENVPMAMQMIAVIYQLGAKHVDIVPRGYDPYGELYMEDIDTIITMGKSHDFPGRVSEIVDIGHGLLDIGTIMNIAFKLGLDHMIHKQNVVKSFKEIVSANTGLLEIIGRFNRFESQLDILLQVLDEGIVAVDGEGLVYSCNEAAEKIVGIKKGEMMGIDGISLIPEIPFYRALKDWTAIPEKIVKIHGYDVVVAVDPIIHSNKLYGAVARIKKFSDAEKKQHRLRSQLISKGHKAKYGFYNIFGTSPKLMTCKDIAKRMAKSSSSVMITGESGTGKELFAQAIHNASDRKDYQFVAVNCGAFPESLLESELFGYEDGAFTGARKGGKTGLFELAHKGTLFLDEIGEMPLNLQARLLRVLQERQVMRLGGDRVIDVDVRIIAATNKDLKSLASSGDFRQDLYFRLNVLPLKIPALRERKEDILSLVAYFKKEFKSGFELDEQSKMRLLEHSWDGNIRELKNYVEYLANLGKEKIEQSDLPFEPARRHVARSDLDTHEMALLEGFEEEAGESIGDYMFVMERLKNARDEGKRSGRRSIYKSARENGVLLGEQEIRFMLITLEKYSFVHIKTGRGGTSISDTGVKILEELKKRCE